MSAYPAPIAKASPAIRVGYRTLLLVTLAIWLLPLLGVALTSIRSLEDISRGNLWGTPSRFMLFENFTAVLVGSRMAQFLLNSFLIALPAVAGTLALSCMAGFALARYRFRGSLLLLLVFIGGNLVPFQVLMIPVRSLMVDTFALYDTRWALIVFHTAFQTGFATLFMRNFISQLPDSLIDSARLDGWSEYRILWHVVLPLVRPALAAMATLIFTFVWNDYFWALVLVHSDAVRPVTAGLQSLRGMWIASWQLISAGAIVAAIPPVLVFFLMQRHLIAGLTLRTADD